MIVYLIAETDIYDLIPYQAKSFHIDKQCKQQFLVQLAENKIDSEYVYKFGIHNLEIPSSIKTFFDAVNHILYHDYISKQVNENLLFIKNNIFSNTFKFSNMKRTESWSAIAINTKDLPENFLVENGNFELIPKVLTSNHYVTYNYSFIEFDFTDIPYIQHKFQRLRPKALKFDNLLTLGNRFLEENKKFRAAGKPTRSPEEINNILETICKPCEYYKNNRCTLCGCYLTAKLKYATSHCPIKRW